MNMSLYHDIERSIEEEEYKKKKEEQILKEKNKLLYEYCDFKLPIEYHNHSKLQNIVKSDLEIDCDNDDNLLNSLYNEDNFKLLLNRNSTLYSTDKKFLKDNQKMISSYTHLPNKMNDFVNQYLEYKCDPDFMNKYQYVQFKRFQYLNYSTPFLYVIGLYNFIFYFYDQGNIHESFTVHVYC
jgi:hypothetical protein